MWEIKEELTAVPKEEGAAVLLEKGTKDFSPEETLPGRPLVIDATKVGLGRSGRGLLIASVGGNFDVALEDGPVVRVKARGIFRKRGQTPLVGDQVTVSADGFLENIAPRKNSLIRPAAANIDQILIVFAFKEPEPHFGLLDRFLVEAERQSIPVVVVFNKEDLLQEEDDDTREALEAYRKAGYPVMTVSTREEGQSLKKLREALDHKVTVLAGPSGVGKSSLINALIGTREEVGDLSEKIARGKNTTRHARLLKVEGASAWIADTPGFTSFYTQEVHPEELPDLYPEFRPFLGQCYYLDCHHRTEPGCRVKEAVESGEIPKLRYQNYVELYDELITYWKAHPEYE